MTHHKKDFRICIKFEKQANLAYTKKLSHNDFNEFKFQPKVTFTRKFEQNYSAKHTVNNIVEKQILLVLMFVIVCENVVKQIRA